MRRDNVACSSWFLAVLMQASVLGQAASRASETMASSPATSNEPDRVTSVVADYCLNIADKAADARIAWQTAKLNDLASQVEAKIALLDQRRADVQAWVERQQQLLTAAEAGLVEIYAKMDPEAAAGQLASLDTRLSSSVLRQLKPREASAILNEMKPDQAGPLVRILAAAAKTPGESSDK